MRHHLAPFPLVCFGSQAAWQSIFIDDAADDASGLCCILNGVDGVDFRYSDPCFCNVEDIMPRSQFSDLTPRELCDANGYGWCPSRDNPGDDAIDAARCEAYGLGCDERYLPLVPVPTVSFAPTTYAPTPSPTRRGAMCHLQ